MTKKPKPIRCQRSQLGLKRCAHRGCPSCSKLCADLAEEYRAKKATERLDAQLDQRLGADS